MSGPSADGLWSALYLFVVRASCYCAMLISDAYRAANAQLHDPLTYYGSYGGGHVQQVRALKPRRAYQTGLDYGAGKGRLALATPDVPVRNYEPVTFPDEPEPADFVACLDVLEHMELECFCLKLCFGTFDRKS